ncbi:VOC family protein [Streptomyces sp. NBC_00525]|uniref:VOC family protein n=1 Tax=Streptomyces sp. NBC_00525 TaxID=2903660 RepID=UPI002E7FCDB8|nr:VOC family protein [Streptomyces sp. NBC_00525]WUC97882.1 glyoxalase [Streptomyces sp. NBC_00525]
MHTEGRPVRRRRHEPIGSALASIGWLLESPGYAAHQSWDGGRSRRLGPTHLVIEQSPALTAQRYDRCRPGLNHLAFHVEDAAATVENLTADAAQHGWQLMFRERHPYAGGGEHYAAYLENDDGFEVELVAIDPPERNSDESVRRP